VIAANINAVGVDATTNFFGGTVAQVPENYASGQPLPAAFTGRVVLIHGDNDDSVPLAQSYAIASHADRLEVLNNVDHFDVIDPDHPSWHIVLDELGQLTD
jgi:pimeloyl-ACP methyl ester carboxylesterase